MSRSLCSKDLSSTTMIKLALSLNAFCLASTIFYSPQCTSGLAMKNCLKYFRSLLACWYRVSLLFGLLHACFCMSYAQLYNLLL